MRVMIQVPAAQSKVQAMRGQGTTISGYIRSLIISDGIISRKEMRRRKRRVTAADSWNCRHS